MDEVRRLDNSTPPARGSLAVALVECVLSVENLNLLFALAATATRAVR